MEDTVQNDSLAVVLGSLDIRSQSDQDIEFYLGCNLTLTGDIQLDTVDNISQIKLEATNAVYIQAQELEIKTGEGIGSRASCQRVSIGI